MARPIIRASDQFPTITLLLKADIRMRNQRTRLQIPFNQLDFDQRPGQAARPFNITGVSWGGDSPPPGCHIVGCEPYRSLPSDDVRETVVAGLILTLDCDRDAPALDFVPLIVGCLGPANETDLGSIELPEVTATPDTAWSVYEGGRVSIDVNVVLTGGLGTFATKNDQEVLIDLEGFAGTRNLSSTEVENQILLLRGKLNGNVNLVFPANQRGTWQITRETTGSSSITLKTSGGQLVPIAMALRPTVNELFVVNGASNSLSVVDSHTGALLRTLAPTGLTNPRAIDFSADGATAYVAVSPTSNTAAIKILDTVTGDISTSIDLTHYTPLSVICDSTNHCLWVSCAGTALDATTTVLRMELSDHSLTSIALRDEVGDLINTYSPRLLANDDFSKIYVWGSGNAGHSTSGSRQAFVIDTSDNSQVNFAVGGANGGGGMALDGTRLYLGMGNRDLKYFDRDSYALLGSLSVGRQASGLAVDDTTFYTANGQDSSISVYDTTSLVESDPLALPYGPAQIILLTVSAAKKMWVRFQSNNAVALVDAGTGVIDRFVALGPVEPLTLDAGTIEVGTDGKTLWQVGKVATAEVAPRDLSTKLFDPQDYIERRVTDVNETIYENWTPAVFSSSTATQVPYARIIRTFGTRQDGVNSDLIPVQRGAKVKFSVWVMRPVDATGTDAGFNVDLSRFDKDGRPVSGGFGAVRLITNDPIADGVWKQLTAEYSLPLTHTPYNNSDGGPVCYVQVSIRANTYIPPIFGDPIPPLQEVQWGGMSLTYSDTARSQSVFAHSALATATVQIGTSSFTIADDASSTTVQAAIRATGGENGAVVVSGGTIEGPPGFFSGAYIFTWPAGVAPSTFTVTNPTDGTWTITEVDPGHLEDFLGLDDTPDSYTSSAGKLVRVNASEDALEFASIVCAGDEVVCAGDEVVFA